MFGKSLAAVIGGIVLVLLLVLGLTFAIFGVRWLTAGSRGAVEAREQIQSGDFRIEAYDHFYNLCAAAQTNADALNASYIEESTAVEPRLGQVHININAQTIALAETINQYNADARKSYTAGQFRASDLPFVLVYDKGDSISCTAA